MAGALTAAIAAAFSGGAAVVTDEYFEYTTLLLPGNGTNGAQNNTFLDGSTNNFTITRNGNTTQGTFSPFSQTGWGNYFKTGTDAITSASSSGFAFGTGNYTIEAQIYWSGSSSEFQITGSSSNNFNLYVNATTIGFYDGTSGITRTTTISKNTWLYIALVRSGGLLTFYLNGSAVGSTTASSTNYSAFQLIAGRNATSGTSWADGYISNLRVSNVARTISSTPTSAYTQDSNTVFLLGNTNRFLDQGVNGLALTITGTPTVVAFSPFNPTASWSAATNGGSGYFDGSGDYLSVPASSNLLLNGVNSTLEGWFYLNASPGAAGSSVPFFTQSNVGSATSPSSNFWCFADATTFYFGGGGDSSYLSTSVSVIPVKQWFHLAIVITGGTSAVVYINGSSVMSGSGFVAVGGTTSRTTLIGYMLSGGPLTVSTLNGYCADYRIVKGTAVYTSNFTPPTAPLTNITNTSLLLNFTNAGIYDATSKNDLETVGNAQISTAISAKWGSGSMYFNGTNPQHLLLNYPPTQNALNGAFTIDFWIYWISGTGVILSSDEYSSLIAILSTGKIEINTASSPQSTGTISANTWTYLAFTRNSSGVWTLYINGSADALSLTNTSTYTLRRIGGRSVDNCINGYLQDFRVTKGYVRAITTPTAAFPTL